MSLWPIHPRSERPRVRRKQGRAMLAVAVLVTALLAAAAPMSAGTAPTGSAGATDTATSLAESGSSSKPTVVLVHGAWADGSGWAGVILRLQIDGYPVRVPPNPLRGIGADSASLAAFLNTITGPIILVGHSYGGAVITNAATGNP